MYKIMPVVAFDRIAKQKHLIMQSTKQKYFVVMRDGSDEEHQSMYLNLKMGDVHIV